MTVLFYIPKFRITKKKKERKKERGSLLYFPHFLHISLLSIYLLGWFGNEYDAQAYSILLVGSTICSEGFGILMCKNFEPNAYLVGIGPHWIVKCQCTHLWLDGL